jgi:hypothetical protein
MRRWIWLLAGALMAVLGWRMARRPPPPKPAQVAAEQVDEPPAAPTPAAVRPPADPMKPHNLGKPNEEWEAWKKKIFAARAERRKRLIKLANQDKKAYVALPEIGHAGALPKEYVKAAMDQVEPLIEECFNQGLAHDPTISRRVTAYFEIDGEPDVGGVFRWGEAVAGMGHDEPHLFECIKESSKTVKLPPPEWGGRTSWGYTFDFNKSKDGGA